MAISRMQQPRQQYGLGSLVKKAFKGVKKIIKSPIGKAALLGGGLWGLNKFGIGGGGGGLWKKLAGSGLGKWFGGLGPGQKIFTGLAGAGIAAPFIQKALGYGPYKEEEVEEVDWTQMPSSILNLRNQAQDYYRAATPDYIGSPFMPDKSFVPQNFYAADGGRAGLLNGGEAGEAQMEQMLRAEYLKYKNKGGTMPYEQFKILVMKQAQQGQMPNQMMANGGRIGYAGGGDLAHRLSELIKKVNAGTITPQEEHEMEQLEIMLDYGPGEKDGGRIGLQWGGPPGGGMGHVGRTEAEGGQFGSSYGPGRTRGGGGQDVMPATTITSPPKRTRKDDKINTMINNMSAVSKLKNFSKSGNPLDFLKVNPYILGGSYLYNRLKNNSAMAPGDEYDDIPGNLMAELSKEQQQILNRPDIKFSYDEDPKGTINKLLGEGSGFPSHNIKDKPATKEDIEKWYAGTYKVKDGGRIGYANGGMNDRYTAYLARRNQERAEYNPSRGEYESYVSRPIQMGQAVPEGGFDEIRRQRAERGPSIFAVPAAQGGRIGAQEGGLMDLGGQEKDYRENGGFVPIGGEERADDVPARLSKNEFVFTADAVRAAGGGDIDAGSEVMQNIMDNLEQGGEVSEESQGQNPAQGMYNNYEQLQSRVA